MKLEGIVGACNDHPTYIEFVPLFIQAWKKLFPEALVRVYYIGTTLPAFLEPWKESIEVFPPVPGLHTAYQAQTIRLLAPRHLPVSGAVLISDIDMLPMNKKYYEKAAEAVTESTFVTSRPRMSDMFAMCYCLATPNTWSAVFGTKSMADQLLAWKPSVYTGSPKDYAWFTDQRILGRHARAYANLVSLKDADLLFNRLDRIHPHLFNENNRANLKQRIQAGIYHDYHALRPYSTYKEQNDFVLNCLLTA